MELLKGKDIEAKSGCKMPENIGAEAHCASIYFAKVQYKPPSLPTPSVNICHKIEEIGELSHQCLKGDNTKQTDSATTNYSHKTILTRGVKSTTVLSWSSSEGKMCSIYSKLCMVGPDYLAS